MQKMQHFTPNNKLFHFDITANMCTENKMFINTCRYIMALRNIQSTLQLHINSNGSILQKQGIKRIYDVELKAALHKQT